MEEKKVKKINFFKKIWYSIGKISKYEEMREEGVLASIKYFLVIIALASLIMAIISTVLQVNMIIKPAISYLESQLPEMTFKDNQLSLKNQEAKILDEEQFKLYFGNAVVINPLLEEQQAIDEYYKMATEKNDCVVFLSDEYIKINKNYSPDNSTNEGVEVKKYSEVSSNYVSDTSKEYTEKDVIEFFNQKTPYSYYIMQFFMAYLIMIGILYGLYIIIISLILWGTTKILKLNWTLKKALMNSIYSTTLSMLFFITYMLLSYFTKIRVPYYDVLSLMLVFIYIYILLFKERKAQNK